MTTTTKRPNPPQRRRLRRPSRWEGAAAVAAAAALAHWGWPMLTDILGVSVLVVAGVWGVWRCCLGPRLRRELGADGWLGWRQLHAVAGAGAVRRQAAAIRPGLTKRGIPVTACGAMAGRVVSGSVLVRHRAVYSPCSRGILVVGPPGSGKSSWLVGPILDAPGAAYVSSTKTELVAMTSRLRAERGPVSVFNPTGLGEVVSTVGWDPVSGCDAPPVADARARALVRGGGGAANGQHSDFWSAKASEIVRCYLLAAALSGVDMGVVMDWALNPDDDTPVTVLESHPFEVPAGWVGTYQRNLSAAPNERSGYFSAVIPAVAFMDNPLVADACRPAPGTELDVEEFVSGHGTIYVIAGEGDRRVAPLLTALTEAVFDAAKRVAATHPGGRLDPPMGLFLDEIANTTPVPLDLWAADSRGWGITVCAVVQDLAQLESRWGPTRAQSILANLPTKVVLPGVTATSDLDALAYLAGHRRRRQVSQGHSDTADGRRSRSVNHSWANEPVVAGHTIYALPRWHAYILGLGPRAVIVRFEPGYRRTRAALRHLDSAALPTPTWAAAPSTTGVVIPIRRDPDAGADRAGSDPRTPEGMPGPAASERLSR